MDISLHQTIVDFLAQHDTLAIATVDADQPYVTRVFFAENVLSDDGLILYGTFITTSRKLSNLKQNPRVGIFIGPAQPTVWIEATAIAHILTNESSIAAIREKMAQKSPTAAQFLARIPVEVVELQVKWLRITNLTGQPTQEEITFETTTANKENHA